MNNYTKAQLRMILNNKNKKSILLKLIRENKAMGKIYVSQNKLTQDEFDELVRIDPSKTKKFVGWMAKQWIENRSATNKFTIDDLRNTIEEYNVFLEKGKAKTKDLYAKKEDGTPYTFADLRNEVDDLNKTGEGTSVKELEEDYEIVVDNDDILIAVPHTHEASRKLGLTHFAYRDCKDTQSGKDSAWCTTYKAPDHFNTKYYNEGYLLYYVRVKSQRLIDKLKKKFPSTYDQYVVMALVYGQNKEVEAYDGLDKLLSKDQLKAYMSVVGIK